MKDDGILTSRQRTLADICTNTARLYAESDNPGPWKFFRRAELTGQVSPFKLKATLPNYYHAPPILFSLFFLPDLQLLSA